MGGSKKIIDANPKIDAEVVRRAERLAAATGIPVGRGARFTLTGPLTTTSLLPHWHDPMRLARSQARPPYA